MDSSMTGRWVGGLKLAKMTRIEPSAGRHKAEQNQKYDFLIFKSIFTLCTTCVAKKRVWLIVLIHLDHISFLDLISFNMELLTMLIKNYNQNARELCDLQNSKCVVCISSYAL